MSVHLCFCVSVLSLIGDEIFVAGQDPGKERRVIFPRPRGLARKKLIIFLAGLSRRGKGRNVSSPGGRHFLTQGNPGGAETQVSSARLGTFFRGNYLKVSICCPI